MRYFGQPRVFGMPLGVGSHGMSFAQYVANVIAPTFWLRFTETGGTIALNSVYGRQVGAEISGDPGMDDLGWWVETGAGPGRTITWDSSTVEIASDGSANVGLFKSTILTAGDTYQASITFSTLTITATDFFYLTDPSGTSRTYQTWDNGDSAGTYTFEFICQAGGTNGLFLWFPSGNIGTATISDFSVKKVGELDGGYSGPTLNGDTLLGQPAPTFDGVNDYVQLEHNRLESVFDPTEFTVYLAIKMSAAVMQNATAYDFLNIGVDASNYFSLYKNVSAGRITARSEIGGVIEVTNIDVGTRFDDQYALIGLVVGGGNQTLYIADIEPVTEALPAGTWTGSNLAAAFTALARGINGSYFVGTMGQATFVNRAITQAEWTQLYNVFKAPEPNAA